MEAAKENAKVNGKSKTNVKKVQPIEESKLIKETGWSIARKMLGEGAKEEAIKKALHDHLAKTIDPKQAMDFYCTRMAYRMLFRAKRQTKAAKKEAKL